MQIYAGLLKEVKDFCNNFNSKGASGDYIITLEHFEALDFAIGIFTPEDDKEQKNSELLQEIIDLCDKSCGSFSEILCLKQERVLERAVKMFEEQENKDENNGKETNIY